MEEKLIKYLDEIVEALKKGIDFAGEQAPLLVQEYLAYSEYFHWIMIVLCLFAGLGLLIASYYFWQKSIEDRYEMWELPAAFSVIISFGCITALISNIVQLIKLYVAPRVYLIEKIGDLL